MEYRKNGCLSPVEYIECRLSHTAEELGLGIPAGKSAVCPGLLPCPVSIRVAAGYFIPGQPLPGSEIYFPEVVNYKYPGVPAIEHDCSTVP